MGKSRIVYTMSELQTQISAMFTRINEHFYGGELEKVIFTFEGGYKRGAFGWIECNKNWQQNKTERYCINISADYLNRSAEDICATLMHEMVHLYCLQNDIKDTSRSGIYHNKRFKAEAEKRGLIITEADKIGWSLTALEQETKEWLKENAAFAEIRVYKKKPLAAQSDGKPKQSSRKYICPCCGLIVRATKECRIKCLECDEEMELQA